VTATPVVTPQPWREPAERFAAIAGRPHAVWLDTATPATAGDRYSILASEPSCVFRAKGRACAVNNDRFEGDPFAVLHELLRARQVAPAGHGFPTGAAIGYFGYDLRNLIEELPATAVDDVNLPDCWFGFYDNLLVFDHIERQVWEVGGGGPRAVVAAGERRTRRSASLQSNFTRAAYCAAVRRAKEYIAAGDIYQVNLSQRFQCGLNASPVETYFALRAANPAPYCAYLDLGDAQILSSSPECFLRLNDREIVTRPIKGTRPRSADPAELLASPKDNAELLMITDLERNDLGRVCEFGSVHVPELVRVESFATVHHLVATVAGRLRADVSHVQAVRACFPGGSITGAPKIRAMEIIDELEPHARGVYTGAIGFLGDNGVSHLNIAIRTIVHQKGVLTFHAGGGIVADSEPAAEYDETLAKAQGIIRALDQLRLRERPVRA
jgi:para-aminobenzoate synthetase component 1